MALDDRAVAQLRDAVQALAATAREARHSRNRRPTDTDGASATDPGGRKRVSSDS